MGWVNYVIIPQLKMIVTVPREVSNDTTFLKNVLVGKGCGVTSEEEDDTLYNICEKSCSEVTLLDLQYMTKAIENLLGLRQVSCDEFLLFWLDLRGIEYKVVSEYAFNEDKEQQELVKDYTQITTWAGESDEDDYVLGWN